MGFLGAYLLSGTYTKNKNQLYISIEILALVNQGSSNTYPTNILDYFASVEKQWVAMGGFPHNGKAFGFYNPELQTNGDTVTGVMPFNPHYVDLWKQRKKTELEAFAKYQKHIDPTGLFCNNYTYYLGVCSKNN